MTLRVGLAGLGSMGRNHARVLRSLSGVELVGIADEQGDPYKAAVGIPVMSSLSELIDLNVDYVVIALPTELHESAAMELVEARIPMLIEKPIAADVAGAQRIVDAFGEASVLAAVGHIERYNPALAECRRRLERGDLGELYQVATRRQGPFPSRIGDTGVAADLGTHDFDLTPWVTQQPYVQIAAQTANRSGRPDEDLLAATGLLANGIVTNHLVNWLSPLKERIVVVTGETGAFVADTLSADLTFHANGQAREGWEAMAVFMGVSMGDVTRFAFEKPEPLVCEHVAFRDAVNGDASKIVTLADGLHAVEIAQAVLESARSGESVKLKQS